MSRTNDKAAMTMGVSQYDAFIKTIELGGLTKAAEALGYTQSGITHLLDSLEKDCGLRLLRRDRSGVSITSEGQQLLPYFQSISGASRRMNEKINEIQRLESGLVRIGTFTSASAQWLPGIISKFRRDYPKIQFELHHGTNIQNMEWAESGRVDCSFVILPAAGRLETIFLRRDPIVAVLPENHPLCRLPSFPLAELAKQPYVELYEGVEDEISAVFTTHGIAPDTQFVESDDYAVIAMVEQGLGISVLPQLVLKGSSRRVVQKELEVPAYRDLGVAFRDKRLLTNSAGAFLEYVRKWIKEEYGNDALLCTPPPSARDDAAQPKPA